MRKYIAIIIASLALFTGQAHAQRCLPKMQGIEVRANMADGFNPGGNDGGHSFGAALSTYTKKGNKWVFGGEYLLKNNPYKDGKIPVAQFTAEGEEAHNFIVVVEDNFGNSFEMEFDFNNRNIKDDGFTIIPIGNFRPLQK